MTPAQRERLLGSEARIREDGDKSCISRLGRRPHRFHRGGGARPGFHFLEFESELLPFVGKALADPKPESAPSPKHPSEKKPLSIKKLKKIIAESEE